MKKIHWIAAALAGALLFLLCTGAAGALLIPVRTSFGSTWDMYLQEPENSIDVLFFGSSHVYCNIVPALLWEDTGTTAYLMSGPEQTLPFTYYYLKEALKTQHPKLICFEVAAMFYHRYEGSSQANAAYMPMGWNRLMAILHGAEIELWPDLLLPVLAYHDRWQEASTEEMRKHLNTEPDPMAGYTWLTDIAEMKEPAVYCSITDEQEYQRCLEYLKKIAETCEKEGIQLLLFNAPTYHYAKPEDLERLQRDTADFPNTRYADLNADRDAYGIDDATDWYDGLHLNGRGAEKFSHWLAAWLQDNYALAPTEGEDEALWQSRADAFHALMAALEQ